MIVDGGISTDNLAGVPAHAKRLEALGYHGAVTAETSHDPFFPLLLGGFVLGDCAVEYVDLCLSVLIGSP